MKSLLMIGVAGSLFGAGLVLSHMVEPQRVLGFLDITGNWDPTLMFVMAAALAVTLPAFRWVLNRPAPVMENKFCLPTKTRVDTRLVLGAILFGIGWGLAGYCPGPAVTALALGWTEPLLLVAGMLAGGWVGKHFSN